MGILSDTLEDNKERVGQILSALSPTFLVLPTGMRAVLGCPICTELLVNEDELQRHILSRHRHLQVYVKLNGCVLQEVSLVDRPISDLAAVLLGDTAGMLSLTLGDTQLLNVGLSPGRPLRLEKRIPPGYTGTIRIQIAVGKAEREFVVYCGTQPELNVLELDEAIWNLQSPLLEGTEPDWLRFQQQHLHQASRNSLESRYMQGFYSYVLGCYLEMKGSPQAAKHLEEALGRLRPFATVFARTARHVLAIKLNAFRILKDCGPKSRFHESNRFFNGKMDGKESRHVRDELLSSDRGLWVDHFLEQLLAAIANFRKRDFETVEHAIADLRRSSYFEETNNRDKVTLLQARTANALKKPDVARRAYIQLIHHPQFGAEAARYCE